MTWEVMAARLSDPHSGRYFTAKSPRSAVNDVLSKSYETHLKEGVHAVFLVLKVKAPAR